MFVNGFNRKTGYIVVQNNQARWFRSRERMLSFAFKSSGCEVYVVKHQIAIQGL